MDDQMFLFLQVLTFINIQYVEKKLLLWGKIYIYIYIYIYTYVWGFPGGASGRKPAANANAGEVRNVGSIPGLGRSHGEGNGNPLRYSFLVNPMDRGAWWAAVHGVAKSWKRLSTQCIYR